MAEVTRTKMIREGALAGLISGLVFASGQILVAAAAGSPPGAPWSFSASLVLGSPGMEQPLRGLIFLLGAAIHFGLSTLYGAGFGLIVSFFHKRVRNDWAFQLTGGFAYGLALWLINIQIIGRLVYPWYLELNPAVQLLVHGLFFGLPLATWMGLRIRDVEVPGVHEARHRFQTSTGDEELLRLEQWESHRDEAAREVFGGKRVGPGGGERPTHEHPLH